jgi:GDP-L-fucose synthase
MSKKVLITGASGMVGHYLVEKCMDRGYQVIATDLRYNEVFDKHHDDTFEFVKADLRNFNECKEVVKGVDIVFHVAGVKGSPRRAMERPNEFFTPLLQFNTNMMEAARLEEVEWYVYTSSNGVYAPSDRMREDDVWKTSPSDNDKFAGWAKRIGELQSECYKVHYGSDNISIVRPANIYGKGDNFGEGSMVIPSIIKRVCDGESPLVCWGDGTPTRDFIHASDVADGILLCYDKKVTEPINLGSGNGFTIKELVETVVDIYGKTLLVEWDSTKPNGDPIRLMDTTRANKYGFSPTINLRDGIKEVMNYYNEKL